MTVELLPIRLPASADPSKFEDFGREVRGVDPGNLSPDEFNEIHDALYKYSILVFKDAVITPEQQYALTKAFDPQAQVYGHGTTPTATQAASILHPDLKTLPAVPQVQLIGNGPVHDHHGIPHAALRHPSHTTFHKTRVSPEDERAGATRFYRWHIDAALYALAPPRVTTLYGLRVPRGARQTCRYDDGTGDELEVPLGTTAFVSGRTMFELLPREYKSLAVRARVLYAPHPYVWMTPARALPTGLGIESEGLEVPWDKLPPWDESKLKRFPVLWKNPVTGALHFQVHPCAIAELHVDPLPESASREGALFPDGARLTDLKEVRDILYRMQRPAIAPSLVYPHDWSENDLVLFHNRGLLHTVVGSFTPDQGRVFHQCNLAASDEPIGPSADDVARWA